MTLFLDYISRFFVALWAKILPQVIIFAVCLVLIAAWVLERVNVLEASEAMWMTLGSIVTALAIGISNLTGTGDPPAVPESAAAHFAETMAEMHRNSLESNENILREARK